MKISTIQYLAYDSNKMYIGSFEDKEYAQKWADKHGGYIDRHKLEREENCIYDKALRKDEREKTAREIFKYIEDEAPNGRDCYILDDEFWEKLIGKYGVSEEEL